MASPAGTEVLHRDLEDGADLAAAHPFVRALAGEISGESLALSLPEEEELDALDDADTTFPVVDADGSQRLCLAAAARGHSFVIQGAPGTGKSQTIVNLVADCLAKGKRVLVVSPHLAALDVVVKRLQQVGLGDYLLELYGSKANAAEVLAELGRCLQERPQLSGPLPAGDFQKLKNCRDHLTAYVRALHAVREPLQRSAWSALAKSAKFRTLPSIPLGLPLFRTAEQAESTVVVTEFTPLWLDEARQAVQRLQQLWHIREQPDFPWAGFKGDRYTRQLRDDVAGLVERVRSRLERLLTTAEQYASQVGCKGPVAWLVKVGDMLESAPAKVHAPWLKTADLAPLLQDLDHCADAYQRLGQARAPLTARHGPSIWQLPEGTAANVERAWQAAVPLLPPGDDRGAGLLSHQQQLRGWAAETQKKIPGWIADARTLEKWLAVALPPGAGADTGEGKTDPSPLHLRQLQRLANLCMADNAPERTWVHNAQTLEDARRLITSAQPVFADFHKRKHKLLEVYKESFFELDLARMAGGFAGPYQSWLRILSGSFRRDRRALRRRSRTEIVPETVAQDVLAGRDLLAERARIEADQATRKALLGRYENGLDTDFDAAERATRVAAEAVELVHKLGLSSLPARFVDVLCAATPAPEKIRAAAKRLHDSLGAWHHASQELQAFLPMAALPGTGRPLDDSALSALNQYARDLQAGLNQFAALTDPVLARATNPPPDAATLVADLLQAAEVLVWEASNETEGQRWKARFGPAFQGVASDWNALRKALNWTKRVQEIFQGTPPERFVQLACREGKTHHTRDLRTALEQYEQALHGLELRFDAPGPLLDGKRLADQPPEVVKQRLAVLRDRVGELADWIDCRQLPIRFGHLGLPAFWEGLHKNPPPRDQILDIFMKGFLECWLESVFQQDSVLGQFRRTDHEQIQAEFRERDRHWLRQNAQRIAERALERRPAAGSNPAHPESAFLKEARLNQDLSLPQLFERIPDLLPRLKPCLFLNPLEANRLLPAGMRFDLVIVDEAGQIPAADALSAIGRGQQVIIAGDDQQLPPMVAVSHGAAAESDSIPAVSESLMDACLTAGLPHLSLRWHYASQDEALIAFANHHFHDNRLGTFPVPYPEHPDLGVKLHLVPDGVYERGQNQVEARALANLVLAHFRAHPDQSLGVVACCRAQKTAIVDELDRRLLDEPALERFFQDDRLRGFFVKDLETLEGDERDVMMMSVAYARDAAGRQPASFAPLDREEGPRRLHMAITGARQKLVLVASIRAGDFDPKTATAEGLVLLRQFLEYAERGGRLPAATKTETGPLETDIIEELQARGYTAQAQVGMSDCHLDVAVADPDIKGRFLLGIELDGPNYFAAATARDRDRLRHEILERLGWQLVRIWAPAWIYRRQEEIDRLCQALDESRRRRSTGI